MLAYPHSLIAYLLRNAFEDHHSILVMFTVFLLQVVLTIEFVSNAFNFKKTALLLLLLLYFALVGCQRKELS